MSVIGDISCHILNFQVSPSKKLTINQYRQRVSNELKQQEQQQQQQAQQKVFPQTQKPSAGEEVGL